MLIIATPHWTCGKHIFKNSHGITFNASFRRLQTQATQTADRFYVLFMGRDEFSCLVLKELFEAKDVWNNLTIVTQPDVHVGRRGTVLSVSPLKLLGEKLDIPVHTIPKTRRDFKTWQLPDPFMPHTEPDVSPPANHILVTASFGRILTGKMLNSFQPSNRLNVHPSLLPAYRGPAPIQHAIMNNEKETGVCIIKMLKKSEGIDAGSLWGCQKMGMPNDATYTTLRDKLGPMGGQLLVSIMRDLLRGKAVPLEQSSVNDTPKATAITSTDALIDFTTMSASQIDAKARAISHQKPLYTNTPDHKFLHLQSFSVLDPSQFPSRVLPSAAGQAVFSKKHGLLIVRCAEGTLLGVGRIKPEGKSERGAQEWWNGMQGEVSIIKGRKEISLARVYPSNSQKKFGH